MRNFIYLFVFLFVVSCSTSPKIYTERGTTEFDNLSFLKFSLTPSCGFFQNTLSMKVYYRENNSAPIITFKHAGISNYVYNHSIELRTTSSNEVITFVPNKWSWERDYRYTPGVCVRGQCTQSVTDYWETLDYLDKENNFRKFLNQLKNATPVDDSIELKYRTKRKDNSTTDVGTCTVSALKLESLEDVMTEGESLLSSITIPEEFKKLLEEKYPEEFKRAKEEYPEQFKTKE